MKRRHRGRFSDWAAIGAVWWVEALFMLVRSDEKPGRLFACFLAFFWGIWCFLQYYDVAGEELEADLSGLEEDSSAR